MKTVTSYTKSEAISKEVIKKVEAGVSIKDILASLQRLQNAPRTLKTFYKYYGEDVATARADTVETIGNVVISAAKAGDFKAAEFYLRSKGGWSPNSTINESEQDVDPDEDSSAIDALLSKLGKTRTDEDE